jgi:hypothetical protein
VSRLSLASAQHDSSQKNHGAPQRVAQGRHDEATDCARAWHASRFKPTARRSIQTITWRLTHFQTRRHIMRNALFTVTLAGCALLQFALFATALVL